MPPLMPLQVHDHWIPTDTGRVFARTWTPDAPPPATAPTLLLLHDSLGSVELWRDFPPALCAATGLRVAAYDRLGHGHSDPHPARAAQRLPRSFEQDEARDIVPRMRDALDADTVVLIGHSAGGGIAICAAALQHAWIVGVVSVAAQQFREDVTVAGLHAARAAFAEPGQIERLAKYHGDKAQWVLDAWINTWLADDFIGWNLDDECARITCPLLVVHGQHDEFASPVQPQRIASLARGPSMLTMLDCGHVPHREAPEALCQAIATMLRARALLATP